MELTSQERTELSERIKNVRDMGGIVAVARKGGITAMSIHKILNKEGYTFKLETFKRIKTGLKELEAERQRVLAE